MTSKVSRIDNAPHTNISFGVQLLQFPPNGSELARGLF